MTTTWRRVQGDVGDTIVAVLGGVTDLDNVVSIEAHVARGDVTETLAAAVTDSEAREVTVELGDANGWLAGAEPAAWRLEIKATFANGAVLTWPQSSADTVIVRRQLAADSS